MGTNEYRHDRVKGFDAYQEGNTLVIKGAYFLPREVDYNDIESMKILASAATHTADGLYYLVKNNCDTETPNLSKNSYFEMYLSLAGLACEIYMKAIVYFENLHNGKQQKTHDLNKLFEMLPEDFKVRIKHKINDIEMILLQVGDMFKKLRYDFELNHIQGDYLSIFTLMEEVKTLAHTYPQKETGAIKSANGVLSLT